VLYVGVALLISVRPEKGQEYYHLSMAALTALALACILAAWSRSAIGNAWANGLLILLMLVELGNVSTARYQPLAKPLLLDKLYQNQDIASFFCGHAASRFACRWTARTSPITSATGLVSTSQAAINPGH
jgi:hypothetical protein